MIKKISAYLKMIRISHSIFALPFAFTSALIASNGHPTLHQFFWITTAMVGARSGAMGFNRYIDREIDSHNPRTSQREIPSGKISPRSALAFSAISFALLVLSAFMLNPLCLKLSPIAIGITILYSYTKRFTWASHLVLGIAISASPLGAWIAITGKFSAAILPLALSVVFWLAGFDILYALQDMEFDRKKKLFSIPARFGIENSILISRLFHLISWDFLVITGFFFRLGIFYWIGVAVAGLLLIYEHRLIKPNDLSKLDMAFFNMNGYISITILTFTFLSFYIKI